MTKRSFCLIVLLVGIACGYGQTTLSPGDIAVTGFNSDDLVVDEGFVGFFGTRTTTENEFTFVLLKDVEINTSIRFTDNGWKTDDTFRPDEGIIIWTATSALTCGTEITIPTGSGNGWVFGFPYTFDLLPSHGSLDTSLFANFELGTNGDQILAYQGTEASPSFVFAINFNGGNWRGGGANNNSTSAIPLGLTRDVNAANVVEKNNGNYDCAVTSGTTFILEAICDKSNWDTSDTRFNTLGGCLYGCQTLSPGDIAITGFNSDIKLLNIDPIIGTDFFEASFNESEFTFVLLKDVASGTIIKFTDNGWLSTGNFRSGEGTLVWTAPPGLDLPCGTEIIIDTGRAGEFRITGDPNDPFEEVIGTVSNFYNTSQGSLIGDTTFNLSTDGDQILAFQNTNDFIAAINFNSSDWSTDSIDEQTSALPTGLSNGITAIHIDEVLNAQYNCTVAAGSPFLLVDISNPLNWDTSDFELFSPLGGCTFAACPTPSSCTSYTTWRNGTWDNGIPSVTTGVSIEDDYNTATDGNFSACWLYVRGNSTLTIGNSSFLEVVNNVLIEDNLVVETQGNFVQRGAGTSAGTFTGNATLNKTTPSKAKWYHYTYWSSPVVGETIGNVFPLVDGDRRYYFDATKFVDKDLPLDDVDDNGDDWQYALGALTMAAGTGYAVTGIRSSTYPAVDNVTFSGAFNTGDKIVDITFNSNNDGIRWNFIGNPYPSAIDFDAFHADNLAIIEGVAYFWSQASPPLATNPGNEQLNFNQDDYAVYNIGSGGVATRPGGAGVTPNGNVASTQGFFTPAITAGTVTFTNDMRETDAASNSQFFKGASSKKSNRTNALDNKLWVNLTTNNGVFNQILVAYVDGATNHKDAMAYDAPKLLVPGFAAALYTNIDGDSGKYIIQGKDSNSINEDEIIKLGFKTSITVATLYKLSIDHLEGEFLNNTTIFIKDNVLNTVHNLTDSDYSFTSEVGEFNERFEIIFKEDALSTDHNNLENNTLRIVELYNDEFLFKTSDALTIKTIAVFDLLGRQLYDLKGHQSSETFRLSNLSNAAYVVKVQLSNGAVITKKIIKK